MWAKEMGYSFTPYPADWDTFGRRAGPLRNTIMVKKAEFVVAFPAPDSIGTLDTIRKAKRAKKPLIVFNVTVANKQ